MISMPTRTAGPMGGDFVGRWLDGMAHYHRMPQFQDLDSGIMEVVERLIEFQSPNGFFGRNYIQSEYGGTLQIANALLETHRTYGDPAALESAARAVTFFMGQCPHPGTGPKFVPKRATRMFRLRRAVPTFVLIRWCR